jgi:hypothetical protein
MLKRGVEKVVDGSYQGFRTIRLIVLERVRESKEAVYRLPAASIHTFPHCIKKLPSSKTPSEPKK